MTREEAIDILFGVIAANSEEENEALDMAIEALKNKSRPFGDCSKCIHTYGTLGCCTTVSNEWVYDCEHGMEQYKNTKAEPSDDGTLEVKVEDATKVGRVLISDGRHRGGLYYPDEDEPQGDLISRAEAIDALRYAQHRFTVADEAGGMGSVKWSENVIYFAAAERVLTELPSAGRPKGEWVNEEGVYGAAYCSECNYELRVNNTNFCPNCGADMRGGEDK